MTGPAIPAMGWLARTILLSEVMILTDGPGRTGVPPIAASREIIALAGARPVHYNGGKDLTEPVAALPPE